MNEISWSKPPWPLASADGGLGRVCQDENGGKAATTWWQIYSGREGMGAVGSASLPRHAVRW